MSAEAPSWILDRTFRRTAIAVAATAVGIGALLTREDPVVDWSLVLPTVAAFWAHARFGRFSSRWLFVFGVGIPLALHIIATEDEVSMFFMVLTVMAVVLDERDRALVAAQVLIAGGLVVLLSAVGAVSGLGLQNWLFGLGFAWGLTELVWRALRVVEELNRTRRLVADQAAVNERRRIARDVHDLVGHSLSVVMLHITGARHLVHKDPDEAERALEQAEEAGRQSLAEIRRTVGLLRDAGDPQAGLAPSADLSDLPTLVDEFVAAGLEVVFDLAGPIERVDPAVGLAGYRIVQEALTNASRHTVGAVVTVTASVVDDTCELAVHNTGGQTLDLGQGAGFGLVSMRERAKAVGGSLIAGPTPDGWSVEATLPVQPAGVTR